MRSTPNTNGGQLRVGNPGNRGGLGRPPSELRALVRLSFGHRVKVLEQIADNRRAAAKDRIRAIDVLGKYGLGTVPTDDRQQPILTAAEVASMVLMLARATKPHLPEEMLSEMQEAWDAVIARFVLPSPDAGAISAADAEVARLSRERRRKAGRKADPKAGANGRRKADAPS